MTAAATCRNHPGREAIGICVGCRIRVCTECVTKVDGINYCADCISGLASKQAHVERPRRGVESEVVAALSAFVLFVVLVALTWSMLEITLPSGVE